jgi:hypothetical protein
MAKKLRPAGSRMRDRVRRNHWVRRLHHVMKSDVAASEVESNDAKMTKHNVAKQNTAGARPSVTRQKLNQ